LNDIEKDTEDDQEDNDESGTGNEELISDDSDKSKLKDKVCGSSTIKETMSLAMNLYST